MYFQQYPHKIWSIWSIVRGCFVLEMVSFRLEVVTSSIQLAMVSGQVTTIYVYGYNRIRTKIMTMTTTVTMTMSAIMTPTMTLTMTWSCVVLCVLLIMTIIIQRWFLGNFWNCLAPRLFTGFSLSFLKVWLHLTKESPIPNQLQGRMEDWEFQICFLFLEWLSMRLKMGGKIASQGRRDVEMSSFYFRKQQFQSQETVSRSENCWKIYFYEINGVQMIPFCITSLMASFKSGSFLAY